MKIFRILILFFFMTSNAFALSQGVNSPTTDSGNWDNGWDGYASDNARATLAYGVTPQTHDYWGYGFTLPTYAKVLGVEVTCEVRHEPNCNWVGTRISVAISNNGGSSYSSVQYISNLPATDTDYTLGSSSNLWGLTLTPAQINSDNFRTQIAGVNCIVEGSLVAVPSGAKYVEELKQGDEVLSFDGNNYQKDIIGGISESLTEKVYVINNELKVTGEHPVFCKEKDDYVAAKELKIGDTLKYLKPLSQNKFEVVNKKIINIHIENRQARVFDIAVRGNKNFWADSYLVHNKGEVACGGGYSWTWDLDWIRAKVYYSIPWIVRKVFYQEKTMRLMR